MRNHPVISLALAALLVAGCAPVISREALRDVDRSLTVEMVRSRTDAYAGRKVAWGGIIIASENHEKTTEVEVLETSLSKTLYPYDADADTKGRFIIEADGYLDTAIFRPGKKITVAGSVKTVVTRKIGKMDYAYPVITPIEIKLFEPPPAPAIYYLNMPPGYGPAY